MKHLNLLAFVIFVGLLTWVFAFSAETKRNIQRPILSMFGIVTKISHAISADEDVVNGVNLSPKVLAEKYTEQELSERYSYLLREVMELRAIKSQYAQIQRDNLRLRDSLGFLNTANPADNLWKLVPARVIGRESATWWSVIKINKGDTSGLVVDSPVLTTVLGRDGNPRPAFVGKVISLTSSTAEVLLLTDERCKVAARVQGTLESGLLMGDRAQDGPPVLKLRYLSKKTKEFEKFPNAEIMSSNAGGVVPVNYFLGIVKDFKSLEFFGEANVEPAVDFAQLTDVFVRVPTDAETVLKEAGSADAAAASVIPPRQAIPIGDVAPLGGEPKADVVPRAKPRIKSTAPPRATVEQ